MPRFTTLVALTAALILATSCTSREFEIPPPNTLQNLGFDFPQSLDTKVDLLFVIDNSGSMEKEQQLLTEQFPKLIEALRHQDFGGRIPDVRIGVITTDVGAGSYGLQSCEVSGGDGGKLQTTARVAGCTPPSDPWISYDFTSDKTNIANCEGDGVECVKEAFSCIARVGIKGCGFEAPLESARRALDPTLAVNKGFLRDEALLAVVFITDEDDCSARNPQLFDPMQTGLNDALGPLTSFRCFEFGVTCDINDRHQVGERKNCKPSQDWLHKVDSYVGFFRGLKQGRDRVLMAAIAGPTSPVVVGKDGPNPTLSPSCQSANGFAVPPLRLASVIGAFDGTLSSICDANFGPALEKIGRAINGKRGQQCISKPLFTQKGALACTPGTVIAGDRTCKDNTLAEAECVIYEHIGGDDDKRVEIPRCPTELFGTNSTDCGDHCPCWRLTARPADKCGPDAPTPSSPFGLDVLHAVEPPAGTTARGICSALPDTWGSQAMLDFLDAQ